MIRLVVEMVLALEAVWAVILFVLLLGILTILWRARKASRSAADAQPAIQEAIALYLGGSNDLNRLQALATTHRRAVESSILSFQAIIGGTPRLAELAVNLGFVAQWCALSRSTKVADRRLAFAKIAAVAHAPRARQVIGNLAELGLKDVDEQIRLEAARALIFSDQPAQVVLVFELVLTGSPLLRLELAPLLRRHAEALCATVIPRNLQSLGTRDLLNLLKILISWECSLPITDLSVLMEHPDPKVRVETMHLLARVPMNPVNRRTLLLGLADRNAEVARAAVVSVGRLKHAEAIPQVTGCLRRDDESLAQLAASVLAAMGRDGQRALQGQSGSPNPIAAAAALHGLMLAGATVSQ